MNNSHIEEYEEVEQFTLGEYVYIDSNQQHNQGIEFQLPSTPTILDAFEVQGIPLPPTEQSRQDVFDSYFTEVPQPVLDIKPTTQSLFDQFREDKLIEYLKHIAIKIYYCALNGELYDGDNIGILEIYMDEEEEITITLDGSANNIKTIQCGRLVYSDDNYIDDITQFILKNLKKIYYCNSCQTFEVFSRLSKDWCKDCYYMDMYKCPDDNCSICMEPLSSKPRFLTECKHYFHIGCLNGLKSTGCATGCNHTRTKKCPLCRTMFNGNRNMMGHIFI